jgi:isoleucyl-tRNA synthetase
MNDEPAKARNYSETLFLPKTDFPMCAGLPQREPEILARWQKLGLYERLRAAGKGRAKFVLHDGPPYANGNIHIGHALSNEALAEKWRKLRSLRRVVTGALELERAAKRIGSSLDAAPIIYVTDADLFAAAVDADLAELCITSAATLVEGEAPAPAFRLDEVRGVAVEPRLARGRKCPRSWKISEPIGLDPQFPDVTPRDAQALREWEAMRKAAE